MGRLYTEASRAPAGSFLSRISDSQHLSFSLSFAVIHGGVAAREEAAYRCAVLERTSRRGDSKLLGRLAFGSTLFFGEFYFCDKFLLIF